ncbi:MAG: cytochrome b [Burkholderiales bacterium]|nr:cytochrome b [Burkholderiales bacterium]
MASSQSIAYSPIAIVLHWLVALLIVAAAALGLYMVDLEFSPLKLKTYAWHKWLGVTVFLLTALRLTWRLLRPVPAPLAGMPAWQARAAALVHAALYVLLFVIPLSGWLMSSALGVPVVYLGVVPLPDLVAKNEALGDQLKLVHGVLNSTLLALVCIHVLAALKHHFIDRDAVLARMLPFLRYRS